MSVVIESHGRDARATKFSHRFVAQTLGVVLDVERLALQHEYGLIVLAALRKHSRQLVIEPAADWPSQMKTPRLSSTKRWGRL